MNNNIDGNNSNIERVVEIRKIMYFININNINFNY